MIHFHAAADTYITEGYKYLKKISITKEDNYPSGILPKGSTVSIMIIAIILSGFITINYMVEMLDPLKYPKHYWFITKLAGSGERLITPLGSYYTIMTFCLLVLSIFVISSYLAFCAMAIFIGDSLDSETPITKELVDKLRMDLSYFVHASVVAKAITAVYMANAFTWNMQNPQNSLNFKIMLFAILILGVVLVTMPRYHVELKLYQIKVSELASSEADITQISYMDLRPRNARIFSIIIDSSIFMAFTSVFFGF